MPVVPEMTFQSAFATLGKSWKGDAQANKPATLTPHKLRVLNLALGAVDRSSALYWMRNGWHARFARELALRASGMEVDAWLPVVGAGTDATRDEFSERVHYLTLPVGRVDPLSYLRLVRRINNLRRSGPAILHVHNLRSPSLHYFLALTNPSIPIFVQDHGFFYPDLANIIPESVFLRRSSRIFVLTKYARRYLISLGIAPPKVQVRTMGVDMGLFKPMNKEECKEKLGLPKDARIILYVGPYTDLRGLDKIIRSFKEIRRQVNAVLVCVGGTSDQQLFEAVKEATPYFSQQRVQPEVMPFYYNAADVTCWFYTVPRLFWTSGVGLPMLESLSCGVPVVSTTLLHLEDTSWIPLVGRQVSKEEELTGSILEVLRKGRNPSDYRMMVRRHYSWDSIVGKTLNDYADTL